jgi:hypothetical protein
MLRQICPTVKGAADDGLKRQAESTFSGLGLSMSAARMDAGGAHFLKNLGAVVSSYHN